MLFLYGKLDVYEKAIDREPIMSVFSGGVRNRGVSVFVIMFFNS